MSPPTTITVVHRLRLERGLTRAEVVKQAPINRKTLKRIEEGDVRDPRVHTVVVLADFYGVRVEWLLSEYRRDLLFKAEYERAA